jgi:hypothetical protein
MSTNLHLDTSLEKARALHRVWRALNDGDCPKCHKYHPATAILRGETFIQCPSCGFNVEQSEIEQIEKMFAPAMDAAVEIFEEWRQTQVPVEQPPLEHARHLARKMKDAAWLMRFQDGIVQGSPFVGESIAKQIHQLLDAILKPLPSK